MTTPSSLCFEGFGVAFMPSLIKGFLMFCSTIQILKVDEPVEKTSPKDQSKYMVYAAQSMLLNDDGTLDKVGRLQIPEAMRDKVKVGIFRATFGLEVAQWGQKKGDIVAVLTDLVSAPTRMAAAAATPK